MKKKDAAKKELRKSLEVEVDEEERPPGRRGTGLHAHPR
jgi:hypothetical protein